jgi:hypothetical protein
VIYPVRFSIRVKAVVRFACSAILALPFLLSAPQAEAQITATAPEPVPAQYMNRWDIYGGAQYSHFNPSAGRNFPATNLLGWTAGATAYFRPVWGIEASVREIYGTMDAPPNQYNIVNPKMSEALFLFGPTFRLRRRTRYDAGLHALVGAAYGSFDKDFPAGVSPNQIGVYNNKLAFGSAFGAFADYILTTRLAVKFVADYQPTRYGYATQNEFAGSVGIVYKFGSLAK